MNGNQTLKKLLGKPSTISEIFHQKTKQKRSRNQRVYKKVSEAWSRVIFKNYLRLEKIILPKPSPLKGVFLKDVFYKRQSERVFSSSPLPLEIISDLLFYSAGIKNTTPSMQRNRFYPSGGSRYPLETYLISQNSELPVGVYHYNVRFHSLEVLTLLDKFDCKKYFNQDFIAKAACIIVQTACFYRTTMKYRDRGYRLVLMEAGYLGQNIYLVSAALNLACCAIGGFIDDELNKLLDIDGVKESVINTTVVGLKK
jgi:SagB-type dehydrogenase family enzyme